MMKKHGERVDRRDVLRRVEALPLWYYGGRGAKEPQLRDLGPSAEDFKAAFGLGEADKRMINTANVEGVALAAIQGLLRKLEARTAAMDARRAGGA